MKIFVLLFLLSGTAVASSCFEEHLRDSIAVNRSNRAAYAELSGGKSNTVLNLLIGLERLSLASAWYFDWRAKEYNQKGIRLFCDEFLPMKKKPVVRSAPGPKLRPFDWESYEKELSDAVGRKDVEGIKAQSLAAVRSLEAHPGTYCMLRHLFESIYRFAYFLPVHAEKARATGLEDPTSLSLFAIRLQVLSLITVHKIDRMSAPVQELGVPLLCNDLPPLLDDLTL